MPASDPPAAATLRWSDALETGLDDVDHQHRTLLDIFNRVAATRGADALRAALGELSAYARYHFGTEAQLMRSAPLRDEQRDAHLRAHQRFDEFVQRALQLVDVDPRAVGDELTGFLAQWLRHHIMGIDAAMAREILALRRGDAAADMAPGDAIDASIDHTLAGVLDGLGERTFALIEANLRLRDEIASRERVEAALRDREARYRDLFMHAPDALFEVDSEQRIALANDAALRLLGVAGSDALRGQTLAHYVAALPGTAPLETLLRGVDGALRPVEVVAAPPDTNGRRHLIVRDIGERRRLQRRAAEASRLEQERLGRELHDGAGQRLVAIGLFANSLHKRLAHDGRRADAELAAELGTQIRHALDEIRALAHGLVPLPPGGGGLQGALAALCADLDCACDTDGELDGIDDGVALQLYRIAQEALSNALRHAGASRIALELRGDADGLTLRVRDDGCGIATDAPEGLGLSTMRYRAGAIGAALSITAAAAGGTEIACRWPRQPG
ncbi:sensor histidine kinase LiaS [mine drainage metagenome]|jgi:hemerythrin-like metal-binding protein|uniref:histidine kinase n=1 Tax=mine drainage metagenome TaxID=410659 RepID=A0A1J5R6T2_9ZZZZ